jgi:hypothetical protein
MVSIIEGLKPVSKEKIYGLVSEYGHLSEDGKYFYQDKLNDDYYMIEMNNNSIHFYKLINPFTIDVPISKWIPILHRDGGPAVERFIEYDKTITRDYYTNNKIIKEERFDFGGEKIQEEYYDFDRSDPNFVYYMKKTQDELTEYTLSKRIKKSLKTGTILEEIHYELIGGNWVMKLHQTNKKNGELSSKMVYKGGKLVNSLTISNGVSTSVTFEKVGNESIKKSVIDNGDKYLIEVYSFEIYNRDFLVNGGEGYCIKITENNKKRTTTISIDESTNLKNVPRYSSHYKWGVREVTENGTLVDKIYIGFGQYLTHGEIVKNFIDGLKNNHIYHNYNDNFSLEGGKLVYYDSDKEVKSLKLSIRKLFKK